MSRNRHACARQNQDIRVSAVQAKIANAALLHTFVGGVICDAGRELERVVAVMVPREGALRVFDFADEWMAANVESRC